MRPMIGITCSFERSTQGPQRLRNYLNASYSDAVYAAGGLPLPLALPPDADAGLLAELLARCDGLMFTGGLDVDPARYGQDKHEKTEIMHPRRDAFEFALFEQAERAALPTLSICLGCQVTAVCRGGKLEQHVDDLPAAVRITHHTPDHRDAFHPVRIEPASRLAGIVGRQELEVNSRHHQVVRGGELGRGLRAVAFAPDGVIEAVEDTGERFLLAVQWHPEDLIDRPEHLSLFRALVDAARAR